MNPIIVFEDHACARLEPLVAWRCVPELVLGTCSLLSRWERRLDCSVDAVWVRPSMRPLAQERLARAVNEPAAPGALLVNARWLGTPECPQDGGACVGRSAEGVAWVRCDAALAGGLAPEAFLDEVETQAALRSVRSLPVSGDWLAGAWDLVRHNDAALRDDLKFSPFAAESPLPEFVRITALQHTHVGRDCVFQGPCVLDAADGPIRIDDDVRIGAFTVIEGPCWIGADTRINAHARLHGPNSIGPVCRIGGEVDGCIFLGFSNKQHAGFLGHACVGSWVNLGAETSNSDLKNTYGTVRVSVQGKPIDTGMQFLGALIGDHAKTGIHTAIPTGALLGFAASVATGGLIPKTIPPLAWLTPEGMSAGDPQRALDVAQKVMLRRNVRITEAERELFLCPRGGIR